MEGKNKMIIFFCELEYAKHYHYVCEALLLLLFCEAKHYDYYYLIYSFYYSFHARHIFTITYYYSFHVRNIIVTTILYIISAGSAKATLLPFRKTILPYSTNYLTRSVWLLVNYY